MKLLKNYSLLLSLMLLIGCSNSDDDNNNNSNDDIDSGSGMITALVNGNPFEAVPEDRGVTTISAALQPSGVLFTLTVAGIDLGNDISQGDALAVILVGTDFDEVNSGLTITNPVSNPLALQFSGNYGVFQSGSGNFEDFDFDSSTGFLKITAIDKENQIVSGEFEYNVTERNTGQVFQIRQGVFTDIQYEVQ